MNQDELNNKIKDGFSIRQLASYFNMAPSTVRYWLKKYNLKTSCLTFSNDTSQRYCPACSSYKDKSDFYSCVKSKRKRLSGWCKICSVQSSIERQRENKRLGIEYKGGRCSVCAYSKCIAALEFHHIDPEKKDPNWNRLKSASWETLKSELDKCILVCANCHREIHNNLSVTPV